MYRSTRENRYFIRVREILQRSPNAVASLRGSDRYPDLFGTVLFYQTERGVLVATELQGLPTGEEACAHPVFGFHIHEGGSCTGDAFLNAGEHYNPEHCPHPYHAGDLPPIFGNHGNALSMFLNDRFSVREIIGKTVILHASPDDLHTQPSGNSGERIACGEIRAT
ncbi:MAG: superoxide dismutase family protein [Clostridia bacterium]|nr:superoxide dismutase family protein [Clostridia bacterium]